MLRLYLDTMYRLLIDVDSLVLKHGLQSVWASVVMAHWRSRPMACGISLDQGQNLSPLHWQVDAYPQAQHQSPKKKNFFFERGIPGSFYICSNHSDSTVTEWIYSMVPYTEHPMSMTLILICCCCSVTQLCPTLLPHARQHARLPCPSLSPRVCSNSCPLSQWCHPSISSSVTPFSSCPQSFPASGSFPMSQFFPSVGQNPCCPKDSHESSPAPQMI